MNPKRGAVWMPKNPREAVQMPEEQNQKILRDSNEKGQCCGYAKV